MVLQSSCPVGHANPLNRSFLMRRVGHLRWSATVYRRPIRTSVFVCTEETPSRVNWLTCPGQGLPGVRRADAHRLSMWDSCWAAMPGCSAGLSDHRSGPTVALVAAETAAVVSAALRNVSLERAVQVTGMCAAFADK